ncbi:MAG: energy transducer TonB [Blastocatellia bacterium]|nr:energy transducer TonB [Blastocatellia bacterium]
MKCDLNLAVWGMAILAALGVIRAHGQTQDLESRAIARAQQIPASQLDPALPPRPFGRWFGQLVGANAGVTWQLTDCGEQAAGPAGRERDLPSCVEATAILPSDRMVIVSLQVGTFRLGLTGKPAAQLIAIEDFGVLTPVRRLGDLPSYLRKPPVRTRRTISPLPPTRLGRFLLVIAKPSLTNAILIGGLPAGIAARGEVPPPPAARGARVDGKQRISEGVLQGNAVNKVTPTYPAIARQMNASGEVQVQITINEEGRVIEAVALSGHPLLRTPAEDAARRWTFKPTTLSGKPVKALGVLTFVFTRNNQ